MLTNYQLINSQRTRGFAVDAMEEGLPVTGYSIYRPKGRSIFSARKSGKSIHSTHSILYAPGGAPLPGLNKQNQGSAIISYFHR